MATSLNRKLNKEKFSDNFLSAEEKNKRSIQANMNKLFLIVDKIKRNNLNTAVLNQSSDLIVSQYSKGSVNSEMIKALCKKKFNEFNTDNDLGYSYLYKNGERKHDKSVLNIGNTSTYRDRLFSEDFQNFESKKLNSDMIEALFNKKFNEINTDHDLGYSYLYKKGEKHDKSVLNIGNTSTYRDRLFSEDFQNFESKKLNSDMIEALFNKKFNEINTDHDLGYFETKQFVDSSSKKLITTRKNESQSSTELKNIYSYSSSDIAFLVHNKNKLLSSAHNVAVEKKLSSAPQTKRMSTTLETIQFVDSSSN